MTTKLKRLILSGTGKLESGREHRSPSVRVPSRPDPNSEFSYRFSLGMHKKAATPLHQTFSKTPQDIRGKGYKSSADASHQRKQYSSLHKGISYRKPNTDTYDKRSACPPKRDSINNHQYSTFPAQLYCRKLNSLFYLIAKRLFYSLGLDRIASPLIKPIRSALNYAGRAVAGYISYIYSPFRHYVLHSRPMRYLGGLTWLNRLRNKTNHAFIYTAIALVLASPLIVFLDSFIGPQYDYALSNQVQQIINTPNTKLVNSMVYSSSKQAYLINPNGTKQSKLDSTPNVLIGQPETGIYTASVPTNIDKGISITNNVARISFSLTPKFNTDPGKAIGGHIIYPLGSGTVQDVYTPKQTELAEDIVINKSIGKSISFPYTLKLPKNYIAFNMAGGTIGIEGNKSIDFSLNAPVITQANHRTIKTNTKLYIKNNNLTLVATNLNNLDYPLTIDPSVTISTSTSFLTGNSSSDTATTASQFSTGNLTGGSLANGQCNSNWTSINAPYWCQSTASSTSLPTATDEATSVVYNGYVYEIGGVTGSATATIDYAQLNPSGGFTAPTCATNWTLTNTYWCVSTASSTSLPTATSNATSVVYNGYVYEIGGYTGSATATIDYAQLSSSGGFTAPTCTTNWTLTNTYWCQSIASSTSLPTPTEDATSVVYNGYVYEIGGYTTALTDTIDYAQIESNGSLSPWTATTSLPTATQYATSVVYNGYVYEIGGLSSTSSGYGVATVDYGLINNGGVGTVNAWATSSATLPTATQGATSVVYNGYVYEIGGFTTAQTSTTDYAQLNSSGGFTTPSACANTTDWTLVGDWCESTTTGSAHLPTATEYATSVVYNGYVYEIGGLNSSATNLSTIDYAQLNSTGGFTTPSACANTTDWTLVGNWCESTTTGSAHLPTPTTYATSIVYNGYVYEIGGYNTTSTAFPTIDYAQLESNGGLGPWIATTSLPNPTYEATSVVYNGYVYEIGGGTNTKNLLTIYYAPILSGGGLGTWVNDAANPLPNSNGIDYATSVVYNGYVYEIGGYNNTSTELSSVYTTGLNSIPRVGNYSMLVDIGNGVDVTPIDILLSGTNTGNAGDGPYVGGVNNGGGITVSYQGASTTCTAFSPSSTVQDIPSELDTPFYIRLTSDGCSNTTAVGEYLLVRFTLDDSDTATFPDIYGNHTTITGFRIFYHPATINRLRGGATFSGGSLQSLDTPPTAVQ